MYSKVNLQVDVRSGLTEMFPSNFGVRQGDNLSPILSNIFVKDIPKLFDKDCATVIHLYPVFIIC